MCWTVGIRAAQAVYWSTGSTNDLFDVPFELQVLSQSRARLVRACRIVISERILLEYSSLSLVEVSVWLQRGLVRVPRADGPRVHCS
jgi:hypothetical protein